MNLNKHKDFFNPEELNADIHIIGCGAIGSTLAEQLVRLGIKKIHLHDFDTVTAHNITNQMFYVKQIGKLKIDALEETFKEINPDITIIKHPKGWEKGTHLDGYIFLAVDSIDTRKEIVEDNLFNPNIKAMFDIRMGLTDAQQFATLWTPSGKDKFKNTMNFTKEEAKEAVPVSACGTTLSISPTIRQICALTIANFINLTKNKPLTTLILTDAFNMTLDAFNNNGPINN